MLKLNVTISGEVEKFILSTSRLYNKSKESVVCDLVAKGYDPEGKVTGEDISKADNGEPSRMEVSGKVLGKPALGV